MQRKKLFLSSGLVGLFLVAAGALWLFSAQPANAQCGSQASSCKNCHEVQGQKVVNTDGTAWHQSHAFGDFCYICHAGNHQAKDIAAAHTGMVAPLSDVEAACQQCHPADLQERAQVYAAALGVEIGSGAAALQENPAPPAAGQTPVEAQSPCSPVEISLDDPNLIDYRQRYAEIVLGKRPVNWGNAILIGLIGLVALGGGGFVARNERWIHFSFGDTRQAAGEYPAEAVDLLPAISALKPAGRKSLKKILEKPKQAEKLLALMEAVVSGEEEAGL